MLERDGGGSSGRSCSTSRRPNGIRPRLGRRQLHRVWTDDVQELAGTRGRFRVRALEGRAHSSYRATGSTPRRTHPAHRDVGALRHPVGATSGSSHDRHRLGLDKAHPAASSSEHRLLLAQVNSVLLTPLTRDDILGVYAGLRPLLEGGRSRRASSRASTPSPAVAGPGQRRGWKYTRRTASMARDAVDAAVLDLDRPVPPSVTDRTPILGAEGTRRSSTASKRWRATGGCRRGACGACSTATAARARGARAHPVGRGLLRRWTAPTTNCSPRSVCRDARGRAPPRRRADTALAHLHQGGRPRTHRAEPVAAVMADVLGWDEATRAGELAAYGRPGRAERDLADARRGPRGRRRPASGRGPARGSRRHLTRARATGMKLRMELR